MTYFNTTSIRGQQLTHYREVAEDQEGMIALFFDNHQSGEWTPEDISIYHPGFSRTPITSVRRAFTNLKNTGIIYKTDNQIKGMYGRPIYTWKYNRLWQQQRLDLA